jgi:uncharacterized protein YrzB (UPF0473 family)
MNEEKKVITIVNDDGSRKDVEVLVAFRMAASGKDYIIYTMNEKDENGNTTIYASALRDENGQKQLIGIESDEEWQTIKNIIKELAKAE